MRPSKPMTTTVPKARRVEDTGLRHDWSWVEASVWTPRMLTALENGVKGGKWYSLMDKVWRPSTLQAAWSRVRANRGAAGIDRISVERFSAHSERYLEELATTLQNGTYRPEAVRRTYIAKGNGKQRPLGIPTVKDRIVQTALKLVMEPILEREFLDNSYGFRPKRGCKDALREVDGRLKAGHTWVVDADFQSYFDTISHERLMQRLGEHISDSRLLALVEQYLDQEIMEGLKRWTPTQGTPQGAVLSPLLANLYLHDLDCTLAQAGLQTVRFADDFVVLCQSHEQADHALGVVTHWVEANQLTLHPDKTHVGNCLMPGQGFEFLGYRFEEGQRFIRDKSFKRLRDKIREKTKRSRGDSMETIIADLNPMLRGWFNYFKHAYPGLFPRVDGFVRRRLRAIRRKQCKSPAHGMSPVDHRRWPNAYFAELGLFTMREARAAASQSR